MMAAVEDRRRDQRCAKDVGMQCSLLSGRMQQVVTVRNFSRNGFYFESGWRLHVGTMVILRALSAHETGKDNDLPRFSINADDLAACRLYRSHALVSVKRCVQLEDEGAQPLFGVGAAVQIITE